MAAKITRASSSEFTELAPGASIQRHIDPSVSDSMACSVVEMENFELEWTVLYDEWLYVLEGVLTMELKDETVELHPGDSIWLADGTWHFYHVKGKARAIVAVYPANWREAKGVDL
jgi:ethanolamine utilization protein EutQ